MRFEFIGGTSRKFWEATVEGATIHLRWGRIGTAGQSKSHVRDDEAAARSECEALIQKKLREGYVRVDAEADAPIAAASAPPSSPASPTASAPPAPAATPDVAPPAKANASAKKLSAADARELAKTLSPTLTNASGVRTWSLFRGASSDDAAEAPREFFELSAVQGAIEIARGKVGTQGRVRDVQLSDGETVDARIQRELAKALADGFTPGAEAAPTPDVPDEEAEWHAGRARWMKKHVRPGYLPSVEEGAGPLDHPRFGGTPALRDDEPAPRCGLCTKPLTLIVQLTAASLPQPAKTIVPSGLVQLLWCDTVCQAEGGWEPFSITHTARILPAAAKLRAPTAEEMPETIYPPKRITGWTEVETYPAYSDQSQIMHQEGTRDVLLEWLDLPDGDTSFANLGGERLLGWPHWIQDVVVVKCPSCDERMEMLLQVDTNTTLKGLGFGDSGIGFLMGCKRCKTLGFVWQSC